MADENSMAPVTKAADTVAIAEVPAEKKQRAPRRQKAAVEATVAASTAEAVKSAKGRKKRDERAGEPKLTPVETPVAKQRKTRGPNKATTKNGTAKQTRQAAGTSAPAIDEIADLIQLEEENKRLRKTLADKLRAENADLRKRLGLA